MHRGPRVLRGSTSHPAGARIYERSNGGWSALSRYRRQIRKSMEPGNWCVLARYPLANVCLLIHRSTLNEPSDHYPRSRCLLPVSGSSVETFASRSRQRLLPGSCELLIVLATRGGSSFHDRRIPRIFLQFRNSVHQFPIYRCNKHEFNGWFRRNNFSRWPYEYEFARSRISRSLYTISQLIIFHTEPAVSKFQYPISNRTSTLKSHRACNQTWLNTNEFPDDSKESYYRIAPQERSNYRVEMKKTPYPISLGSAKFPRDSDTA